MFKRMELSRFTAGLSALGFSSYADEEFNRTVFETKDYKGYNLVVYVDKNTIRCEILRILPNFRKERYRKCYRVYSELPGFESAESLLSDFFSVVVAKYNL